MSEFYQPPVEEISFTAATEFSPQLRTVEPEDVTLHTFASILPFPQPSEEASIIEVGPEPFYWYKRAEVPQLSPLHREILTLTAEGYPGHMIAKETKKSEQTVKNNRLFLQRALRAQTMPEAVAIALANGLIVVPDAAAQLGQLRELTKEEYDLYVLATEHPGEAIGGEKQATFAARVGSAPTTVTNHLTPVYTKLGIRCREQLVAVRYAQLQSEAETGESLYEPIRVLSVDAKTHLTRTELRVLEVMRDDMTNKQIAATLGINEQTVKNHITQVLRYYEAENRQEAIAAAFGIYTTTIFEPKKDLHRIGRSTVFKGRRV